MSSHVKLRPAATAESQLRRQHPQHFLRLLEGHLSALVDSKDTPNWTINPAYHPDVLAFVQTYADNSAFLTKARAIQQNRAQYYARARAAQHQPARETVLNMTRATVMQMDPPPMAILVALPVAVPLGWAVPVVEVQAQRRS